MALAQATKSRETTYTINDAMDVLLSKLDEAIDDMENGRVQTVEEAWAEVVIAQSGKLDVKEKKKYILQQFKYREYAENFSKKIKKAVLALDTLPTGYNTTGFRYRGYDIYMKPCESYLLFYTVDEAVKTVTVLRVMQDGMDWQYIINRWLRENA